MRKIFILIILTACYLKIEGQVIISQVYGGAGCGTAGCSTYQRDYIEIFNLGNVNVNINGWSVQYASATGSIWSVTILANVQTFIPPGGYFLIGESFNPNGVNPLPTPDVIGTIAMNATAGKVVLVNNATALTGACPSSAAIVDFVGYGATANCNEGGSNAPAPGTTTAIIRLAGGCIDNNINGNDFTTGTPNPRNSSSPISPCITLPIVFAHIKVFESGNRVRIEWTNLTETDVLNYAVERSNDGRNFSSIANVIANQNTGQSVNYSYHDQNPFPGTSFYRIRANEIYGVYKYSTIMKLDRHAGNIALAIYPNPVKNNQFSLQLKALPKGNYSIRIFNATGNQILGSTLSHQGGAITEMINLPAPIMQGGIYRLNVTGNGLILNRSFIIQ